MTVPELVDRRWFWIPGFLAIAVTILFIVPASPIVTAVAVACSIAAILVAGTLKIDLERSLYAIPLLLGVEYRIRVGPLSFAAAELATLVVWFLIIRRVLRAGPTKVQVEQKDFWGGRIVLALLVCALPGVMFETNPHHAVSAIRDLLIPIIFFIGVRRLDIEKDRLQKMMIIYLLAATLFAALGLVQFQTGKFAPFQSFDDSTWQTYKLGFLLKSSFGEILGAKDALAVGLYASVNDFGFYLVVPSVVLFAFGLSPEVSKRLRAISLAFFTVVMLALFATLFRTGILIVLASLALIAVLRRRRFSYLNLSIVGLVAVVLLVIIAQLEVVAFDDYGTVGGRLDMVNAAMRVIVRHPWQSLLGGLTDQYHAQDQVQEVHNFVLYCVLHFGWIVAALMLGFYFHWLRKLFLGLGSLLPREEIVAKAILLSVAGLVFLNGMTTSLFDSVTVNITLVFWLAIALASLPVGARGPRSEAPRTA